MRRAGRWAVLTLVALAGCGTPGEDVPAGKAAAPEALEVRAQAQRQGQLKYATDFEGRVGSEWSDRRTAVTPSGRRFLGPFSQEAVTLELKGLPTHELVTVSFELLLIGSWDGSPPVYGPDVWEFGEVGGLRLLHATFSNASTPSDAAFGQTYPNEYPGPTSPALGFAAETGTLGYPAITTPYTGVGDSVYRLSYTFEHEGGTLRLRFAAPPRSEADESWGLDTVRVTVQRNDGGDTRWVRTYNVGSFFGSMVREVAYDSEGNMVVVGDLRGSIEGLPGASAPVGRPGTFVAKLGRDGDLKWARGFDVVPGTCDTCEEDEPFVRPRALATDRKGHIVIAGLMNSDVDFGGGPLSGRTFLVKLDEDGRHVWSRSYGTSEVSFPIEDLATDSSGDIVLVASSLLTVDLGEGPITAPPGSGALVKLSASGLLEWVRFSGPELLYATVAVDDSEQLYVGGGTRTGELVPMLEKLSPRGERRWLRLLEGARGSLTHVAVRGSRVAAVGGLALPYDFPGFTFRGAPGALATPGDFFRGFLVTFSTSGDKRWARAAGSFSAGVSMDARGGVVVGGSRFLGDDLGFGPVYSTPPGMADYVAKYDSDDGDTRWVRLVPLVRDVASARDGRAGVVGVFSDTVDFGEGPVTGGPGANLYLLDLSR